MFGRQWRAMEAMLLDPVQRSAEALAEQAARETQKERTEEWRWQSEGYWLGQQP